MRSAALVLISAAVLCLGGASLAAPPQAGEPATAVAVVNGETVVTVGPKAQTTSGVRLQALTLDSRRTETAAYGTVLDLQPIIDLRARYRAAQAEAAAARATLKASEQQYRRLRSLNELDKNASDRALQAAQASWEAERAKALAANALAGDVRTSAVARWGAALAGQALNGESKPLAGLFSGQQVLLEMALPPGLAAPSTLKIAHPGANGKPLSAQLISASPRADPLTQHATYFYHAPAADLRAGWRVEARVPTSERVAEGVFVPESAVIWHANQPWVYVQTDASHFARRALANAAAAPGGWFATQGWRGGERVVVSGAQLLFSEEFKPRRPTGGKTSVESDDD
jgi:hypothetical protein